MALGHQEDALPISAARRKALPNIQMKACPHGAGQAAYCSTCLADEERVVGLEDAIAELKSAREEQAQLIDVLTEHLDLTKDDLDALGDVVKAIAGRMGGINEVMTR
jgi:hypothetical protein